MNDKEKLKKVQDFINEEYRHHASQDLYYQYCVSYNYTELFTFAKSIMELLQEEPASEDLKKAAWKPSEEQIDHLATAIEECGENPVLNSLYNDLKKLKG